MFLSAVFPAVIVLIWICSQIMRSFLLPLLQRPSFCESCLRGGFCPRSLSIGCNGTIYTPPRPGTLGRRLPLYFGQGFARGQRIGNPAALAACCRSFSGWWPLYHCLRSKVLDDLAGKLLPPFAHAERYAGSRTPVSAAAAPAAIVGGGHHTVPRFQGLSRSFGAILRENG